jgi:MFS family permease
VVRAVKTRAFLTLFAMLFLAEMALIGVMTHLFTHASEGGVPQPVVSWAYGVIGVSSLAGKVGGGALSDRIGRKAAFLLSFGVEGTTLLLLLLPPNTILLYVFAVLLGLSYGGWTPLFDRTGTYFAAFLFFSGICFLAGFFALLLRPPAQDRFPATVDVV